MARRQAGFKFGWATIVALCSLDIALYMDWTLRWEYGFGFARPSWVSTTAVSFLVLTLAMAWLVRERAGFFRHAFVIYLPMLWMPFLASTGNPYFDWKPLPLYQLFHGSLIGYLDFNLAFCAALAHGVLGRTCRTALKFPALWSGERWLGAFGLSLALVSWVGDLRVVPMTAWRPVPGELPTDLFAFDARDPSEYVQAVLPAFRSQFWNTVLLLGLAAMAVSLLLTVSRLLWIRRVRRGRVAGFKVVSVDGYDAALVPTLWPLPRRMFENVLVQVEGDALTPIALLPPIRE